MAGDPMLEMFIFENTQLTERLEEVLLEGEQLGSFTAEHINEIFRIMHTIKGSAAMMEYTRISTLGHAVEDMFYYIREHSDVNPDWSAIADICLAAADFFKQEVGKLQQGLPSDGDESSMVENIRAYMQVLTGAESAGAEKSGGGSQSAGKKAESGVPAPGENAYAAHIFFEDGCKMENIRAYQIVNTLSELCSYIDTVPAELLEDCSDEIIKNGVSLTIYTGASQQKVHEIIAEALFVKSFELKAFQEPSTLDGEKTAALQPDEPVPAAPANVGDEAGTKQESSEAPKRAPAAAPAEIKQSFISVNVDKLDKLIDLMGEIVISVAMVVGNPDLKDLKLDNFEKASAQLLKNTNELQDVVMSVRMIPISSTFHKMHRIVRDTARKLGKDVELTLLGEETEVDKNIIDNLSDPLMHIIRNSMDHGIEESQEARLAAGKAPAGHITLEARNSGSDVIISCKDDGRGLNREKILAKAVRNGMLTKPESEYTDKEIYQFIMGAGFSTNEAVTELSGRGVGMDVVKKNIEKIGGTVLLDSIPGEGMTVMIRIPLTLAILQCIEIRVGRNLYLIPTLSIRQSFKPEKSDIVVDPEGNEMILFRGECYPIVRMHTLFGVDTEVTDFEEGVIIMIEDEGRMTGVFADFLVGEQQVVVKPLPAFITERIGQIRGVSGCSILGDGRISLIIDVKSLTQ